MMISSSQYALLLIVLVNTVNATSLLKVPLIRRSKDGQLPKRAVRYAPLVDAVIDLDPRTDLAYLGVVSVGTPPQSFLVGKYLCAACTELDIDSGSPQLWVADQDCVGCNTSSAQLFNPAASSTLEKNTTAPFTLTYGTGTVECFLVRDTVSFGGIVIDKFSFGDCFGELDFDYPFGYAGYSPLLISLVAWGFSDYLSHFMATLNHSLSKPIGAD
jgi:Eukaryotic aspartyl protease